MAAVNPWESLISTSSASYRELDLRTEIHDILYGDKSRGIYPHGRWLVVRHYRKDSSGKKVPCNCRSEVWGSANKSTQHKCSYCGGHGFIFDDSFAIGYIQWEYPVSTMEKEEAFGSIELVAPAVYFEYNVVISDEDFIIIPVTSDDGELPSGVVQIEKKLKVNVVNKMRSDFGRIEYLRCRVSEEHK